MNSRTAVIGLLVLCAVGCGASPEELMALRRGFDTQCDTRLAEVAEQHRLNIRQREEATRTAIDEAYHLRSKVLALETQLNGQRQRRLVLDANTRGMRERVQRLGCAPLRPPTNAEWQAIFETLFPELRQGIFVRLAHQVVSSPDFALVDIKTRFVEYGGRCAVLAAPYFSQRSRLANEILATEDKARLMSRWRHRPDPLKSHDWTFLPASTQWAESLSHAIHLCDACDGFPEAPVFLLAPAERRIIGRTRSPVLSSAIGHNDSLKHWPVGDLGLVSVGVGSSGGWDDEVSTLFAVSDGWLEPTLAIPTESSNEIQCGGELEKVRLWPKSQIFCHDRVMRYTLTPRVESGRLAGEEKLEWVAVNESTPRTIHVRSRTLVFEKAGTRYRAVGQTLLEEFGFDTSSIPSAEQRLGSTE